MHRLEVHMVTSQAVCFCYFNFSSVLPFVNNYLNYFNACSFYNSRTINTQMTTITMIQFCCHRRPTFHDGDWPTRYMLICREDIARSLTSQRWSYRVKRTPSKANPLTRPRNDKLLFTTNDSKKEILYRYNSNIYNWQELRSSWDGRPFGHNRYGSKIGGVPLGGGWAPI